MQAQLAQQQVKEMEGEVARLQREHAAAMGALAASARGHAAGAAGANPLLGLPAGVGAAQVGSWIEQYLLQDARWALGVGWRCWSELEGAPGVCLRTPGRQAAPLPAPLARPPAPA